MPVKREHVHPGSPLCGLPFPFKNVAMLRDSVVRITKTNRLDNTQSWIDEHYAARSFASLAQRSGLNRLHGTPLRDSPNGNRTHACWKHQSSDLRNIHFNPCPKMAGVQSSKSESKSHICSHPARSKSCLMAADRLSSTAKCNSRNYEYRHPLP